MYIFFLRLCYRSVCVHRSATERGYVNVSYGLSFSSGLLRICIKITVPWLRDDDDDDTQPSKSPPAVSADS